MKILWKTTTLYFLFTTAVQAQTEPAKLFESPLISNNQVFGLSVAPDGNRLFFVNSNGGRKKLQIMESEKKKGKWTVPKPAFFSHPDYREIDPFISVDGNTILYNTRRSKTPQGDDSKDLDIWMLRKEKGKWGKPFPVEALNTEVSETYASIAQNGNIYFGATKQGGYGGGDIYVSKLENGVYQTPQNIGYPINTDKNEGNCFVAPDESFIIFSADGFASNFGGGDLYISFNLKGKWSSPLNLGENINSPENDFCPTIFGKETLFFARSKSEGDKLVENIYQTKINLDFFKRLAELQENNVFEAAFPEGNVYGITFSPNKKEVFTTQSNEKRSVCEIYNLQINEQGVFVNPRKVKEWSVTRNVANPVISHDGSRAILRVSGEEGNPDLYLSKYENEQWTIPIPLQENINTPKDEYYPELAANNHLYYSSGGDVYEAEFKEGSWVNPKPIEVLNTSFSESNIALSRDGKYLVFLSNRTGTYGSYDLYICQKKNNTWGQAVNLGPKINTNAMEYQPRFSLDNRYLYFTRSVFADGKRQGKEHVMRVDIEQVLKEFSQE